VPVDVIAIVNLQESVASKTTKHRVQAGLHLVSARKTRNGCMAIVPSLATRKVDATNKCFQFSCISLVATSFSAVLCQYAPNIRNFCD
jgi:energy-converting hydrogenase Eha subunit H